MCAITAATLGLSASVGTAATTTAVIAANAALFSGLASVGMGIYQANVSAQAAQANLNAQAQAQQANLAMQRQQMVMQQNQSYQALALQQQQQTDQYNLSVLQGNNQMLSDWERGVQSSQNARAQAWQQHELDKKSYQKSIEQAGEQNRLSNEMANRVYMSEQSKLSEKKKRAAFEQQSILAKAIGAKGSILATGRTGQSVGLLLKDVERQKGFSIAQQDATVKSARESAIIGMESGWLKAESENNVAYSQIDMFPQDPYLPKDPSRPNFIDPIGLAIEPTYA